MNIKTFEGETIRGGTSKCNEPETPGYETHFICFLSEDTF